MSKGAGLRTKVGILVAVFIAAGSGGAGILAHRQMSELTYEAGLQHARAVLDALAIPSAVAIATRDYTKLDNFVAELALARKKDVLLLVVVDLDGRLMATSENAIVGTEIKAFDKRFTSSALISDEVWFAFGPDPYKPEYVDISKPIHQGQRWGTLMARFSLHRFNLRLERLATSTIVLSFVVALLGWVLVIFFLSRLVMGPTRKLADMAHRIGEGDLDVRSSLSRTDEIGELSNSLNRMAARLRAYTSGLEEAVRERTAKLQEANLELERLATTDGLTGLKNHRYFQNTLEFELRRSKRHPHQLVLCMLDIDHFKNFNDTHGHPAGDDVLRRVGEILTENLRATDVVARYGGEEFAIILLDTNAEEGFGTAQKLCQIFREAPFEGEELQPSGRLTVSIGLAVFPQDAEDQRMLIRAADLALYQAKRSGRDSVVRYSEEIPQNTGMTSDVMPADLYPSEKP